MPSFNDTRIRRVNDRQPDPDGKYVLYWCQAARRLSHNHALDYALHWGGVLRKPVVVYEGLRLDYPWANARNHKFLLDGMKANAAAAKKMRLAYSPFVATPADTGRGLVRKLAAGAALVVTDDYPAFIVPAQIRGIADIDRAVHAVDGNGVIPLSLLGAPVAAAAHLRPRLHKLFPEAWQHRATAEPEVPKAAKGVADLPFEPWVPPLDVAASVLTLPVDQTVLPVEEDGGTPAGRERLAAFVRDKLARYADGRNEPDDPARTPVSGLSGYLRNGHVGVEEVVAEALGGTWTPAELNLKARYKDDFFCRDPNVNGFLDELITWRDLGFHWHFCRDRSAARVSRHSGGGVPAFNFETMDFTPLTRGTLDTVLPAWAKAQHDAHANDRREFVYTPEELETAATHDDLWNAAQRQLVATGRIHNYLRMLWGKKVLEWSASAEEAYRVLEHLNNKYATDGREPNSYTNILWCFGLFDRPWPPDRPVFGTVRYMSSANTAKKFDLTGYNEYVRTLTGGANKTGTGRLF